MPDAKPLSVEELRAFESLCAKCFPKWHKEPNGAEYLTGDEWQGALDVTEAYQVASYEYGPRLLATLEAMAADAEDAERYRWIRSVTKRTYLGDYQTGTPQWYIDGVSLSAEYGTFDAAVDAARREGGDV